MTISPKQCRAARGLVDLSQTDLAKAAGVARATLADFERGTRTPMPNNLAALQRALEDAGVIFLDADEAGGQGVREKPPES